MMSPKRPSETLSAEVDGPLLRDVPQLNQPRQVHILCAEDAADVRCFLAQVLRRAGYVVTTVEDGRQAWEVLQAKACDLLITDNDMPHLTGIELVAKARFNGLDLPVIMISGNLGKITVCDIENLRFSALLQKPVILGTLLGTVARILDNAPKSEIGVIGIQTSPPEVRPVENRSTCLRGISSPKQMPSRPSRLTVKSGRHTTFIVVDDVDYIEAAANYAILHIGPTSHVLRETLANLAAALASRRFMRVNRSVIVNLNRIKAVQPTTRGEHAVVLQNGKKFLLTRGVREIQRRMESL